MNRYLRTLYALFALSGFCGLIYESIWSHYLKLFLGHAAYAQTVVLIVFIGGLAGGAWLAGRFASRIKRPLLFYAAAEFIVGIAAILFHGFYVSVTEWAYASLLPAACSPEAWCWVQWALAAAMILPQSILLGTTFPLMSGGILRLDPGLPGGKLSLLYFLNSIGAVFGVLASGFLLIPVFGLPGALMTSGICNIFLAIVVYFVDKFAHLAKAPDSSAAAASAVEEPRKIVWILLIVAALTGLSSFVYEIAWIRSLSLVLGSATHSFELMLSSFILGLALGGLWIRKRIDSIRDPIRFLAIVQILMGLAAAATLPVYMWSFDLMEWSLAALAATDGGYLLYMVFSTVICLVVMLPATFLAGMTLPLITKRLLESRMGERSIGQVYAFNTFGAIVGVIIAVHFSLPATGVKGAIVLGAAIDIVLGVGLLYAFTSGTAFNRSSWASVGVVGLIVALAAFHLDPLKLASGVFRHGKARMHGSNQILFHKDGKTATVDVLRHATGTISILTNGKSDGAAEFEYEKTGPASDEFTMFLAGFLPLAHNHQLKDVAVIGFGTGMSTASLLANESIRRVDTIEIEPAMVEGAKHFRPLTDLAYTDPRSHIVIDDAKSYFARSNRKYDLILSEPSNPWVSGVASLFTREFYQRAKAQLNEGGVLAQWVMVYSFSEPLLASVVRALQESFPHFVLYASNTGDLLLIASPDRPLGKLDAMPLMKGNVMKWLDRLEMKRNEDFELRRIGDQSTLALLHANRNVPANSDFFPIVDNHADRARFMKQTASDVLRLANSTVPITEMLDRVPRPPSYPFTPSRWPTSERVRDAHHAEAARRYLMGEATLAEVRKDLGSYVSGISSFKRSFFDCSEISGVQELWDASLLTAGLLNTALPPAVNGAIWERVRKAPCFAKVDERTRKWIDLFQAVGARDAAAMAARSRALLEGVDSIPAADLEYLYTAGLTGLVAVRDGEGARKMVREIEPKLPAARRSLPSFVFLKNSAQILP